MGQHILKLLLSAFFAFGAPANTLPDQNQAGDLLSRALYFADLYNWPAAAPLFTRAETLFRQKGERRNALYSHLGVLRVEQRPIQLRVNEIAALLTSETLLKSDKSLRLFALEVKGDLDGEIDSEAARRDWTEVMQIAQELKISKWVYRAQGQIGFADYYDGDVASCQRNVAAALIAATQSEDVGAQAFFLSATAIGFAAQKMPQQAMVYANKALALIAANPNIGESSVAYEALIKSLTDTGNLSKAKQLCNQELSRPSLGLSKHNILEADAYLAVAEHNTPRAIADLQEVVSLLILFGESRTLPDDETQLSNLYVTLGDLPKAEELAQRALHSSKANEPVILLPARLHTLAQILVRRGKYQEADQLYESAAAIQDTMIGRANSVLTKTAIITGVNDLYSDHFSLVAEHFHDVAAGYNVVEQVRGRTIAELLLSGKDTSQKALQTEEKIAQLRLQLIKKHSLSDIHKFRDAIFLAEENRASNPEITILRTKNFQPVDIHTVQRSLGRSEVILEYVLSDPNSYCLVISALSTHIVRLPGKRTIDAEVGAYLHSIVTKASDREEATALYRSLLAPIQEARTKHDLIIVPDRELHLIPFDALIDGTQKYVVESKTVLYAPSTTSFYLLRTARSSSSDAEALLALGGVPYGHSNIEQTAITRGYAPEKAWDLPASRDEALAAVATLPNPANRLLIDGAATETAFKKAQRFPFAFIHLAVHAFPNDDPDKAALVLLSDPLHGDDGFLEASEIVQMHLTANLVVLSACDTAAGPIEGEEGISTLSTAFLLAGAHTVVSALWPIEDQPTLFLMNHLYRQLALHKSPAEAMAEAKREMLKTFGVKRSPAYWAGFIVEGSNTVSAKTQPHAHEAAVVITVVLVIFVLALLWTYKNKFTDYP